MVEPSTIKSSEKLYFFDSLRVLSMLCVIIYHAVASYSTVVPYWGIHDPATDASADIIRYLFDVFMMPIFFFIAGYFGIKSLQKQGSRNFIKSKFRRLMVYWIFIVLIILPFAYAQFEGLDANYDNYWQYWILYISSIGIITIGPLGNSKIPAPLFSMHFWYISLLFYIFAAFSLFYTIKKRWLVSSNPMILEPPSSKSIVKLLILFGIFSSLGYFVMLLIIADIYWININHITQFQPTDLIIYIFYFGLGIYASSKNWFMKGKTIGRIEIWGSLSVVLSIAFLIVGQNIFTNPNSPKLNPNILITFAFIRSFLCLSIVFFLISFTFRFLNKPKPIIKDFAEQSYNIYLVHIFIVIIIQEALINWSEVPVLVKIIIVAISTLFISYLASKYIGKKFPKATAIIMIIMFFVLMILAEYFPILNEI